MNDTPRNADQNRKRKVGQAQDKMLRCTKKKKKKKWTTAHSKSEQRTIKHPCHATRESNDEADEKAL